MRLREGVTKAGKWVAESERTGALMNQRIGKPWTHRQVKQAHREVV